MTSLTHSLASQTYFARVEKRGGGKYVWCIWTGFCVHCRNVGSTNQVAASGNQRKHHLNIICKKMHGSCFSTGSGKSTVMGLFM